MYSFSPNVKYSSFLEGEVVGKKELLALETLRFLQICKILLILGYQGDPEQQHNQRVQEGLRPMQKFTFPGEIDLDKRFVYTAR